MTNEDKKKYLSLQIAFQSPTFISELEKKNEFISMVPKVLYKYRCFDEYAFDMIENDYIYLAQASTLDDPFDCLTNIDINDIFETKTSNFTDEMMDFIFEIILSHSTIEDRKRKMIIPLIEGSIVNGKIDNELIKEKLKKVTFLSLNQKNIVLNTVININNVIEAISEEEKMKDTLISLVNSKEIVGVCSFTTKRDNKPMWSLYADKYRGYCLEYEVPMDKETLLELCPIIYTKEADNNILKKTIQFVIEGIVRNVSNAKIETNLGCITELLCTKDSDWEYQDEWRLLGNASSQNKNFKLKNIYLGFDVSKEDEDKVLEYSKQKGFGVYKMNRPKKMKITYTRLNGALKSE